MKKLKTFQKKFSSAFSLIELAIVGLIISILMAGIMGSSALKKRAVLSNARTLTNNSPVASIGDLILWYETTSEKSFSADEAVDGSTISTWYDLNPNIETIRNNATQTTAGNRPTYKTNKINGLPAISFTRASGNFLAFNGSSLANNDYTIFVVEQRTSNDTSNTLIGGTSAVTNSNLSFAYQTGSMTIDQYNNTLNANVFTSYSKPTPRIHTFNFNFSTKKYYVNGIEVALTGSGTSYNIAQSLAAFSGAALGANRISGLEKYFQGDIGEVIIFKKSLNNEDKKSVEKYLGKKWSITVFSTPSACSGIITNNGCEASCAVSIVGVSSPSSVDKNTSGTFICTTPQYNDTIPYTCSNVGVLNIGGQSCDVCNTGGNYSFYNGICQGQCTPSSIAGIVSPSPVNAGAATITCNDTANHFTGSVSGICDAGTFTPNSGQACGCASGYSLSSGSCVAASQCTPSSIAGIVSPSPVNVGAATITCNDTANHFTGSVTGVCDAGVFTLNAGQACSCASGYYLSSGSCVAVTPAYYVLTSGTSRTIPSGEGYSNIKIWAIGAGGGGRGHDSGFSVTGGGGGGVAYKTWSISGGETLSYVIGGGGSGGNGSGGGAGGNTSATLNGTTITGNGGAGGASTASAGGTYSGGDGGSNGGISPLSSYEENGSSGGGAIGGISGNSQTGTAGGAGGNSANISELFTALTSAGYSTTSGGGGGVGIGASAANATGFGCGGGGSGYNGNGGHGYYGGGGGGAGGYGTPKRGGNGGSGAVVIKLY